MRGHIRPGKSKNSWEIIYDAPREQGQERKQKSVTFKGKHSDAEKKLREILRQIDQGAYVDNEKITVKHFLSKWLKEYCKPTLTQTTYDSYAIVAGKHLTPALGKHILNKLKPLHLQSYYTKALESGRLDGKGGLSAKTVHSHHRIIHKALETAVKWQLIGRNIADAVDPPRLEQYEANVYGEEEVGKLLKAAEGTRLYVPILLTIGTGLRRGEVLGLRWKDVNHENKTIAVNQSLLSTTEGLQFKSPKNKKSRRLITVPASVFDELIKHKKVAQNKDRLACGKAYIDNDLVFCREDGSAWHPGTFSHNYQDLLTANNFPSIRFHDLRHTHASLLLRQGVHPKIVSERLGHSQIGITLDIYSHILPGIKEQVAQDLDEALFKKVK